MSSTRFALRALALTLGVLLAACAPSTSEVMAEKPAPTEAMTEPASPTQAAMMDEDAMAMPAFFSAALTDVASGTDFTLADFKGKVVLLEPFAQWCPTCLAQQREVVRLRALLGPHDDFVTVGLDIDPNEDAVMLRGYLTQHGFDWLYAVAPAQVSSEIGGLYGSQYLNPPSAPILLIDRHGVVHPLEAGRKSAESLLAELEPLLAEPM
jgi:cytochrome oxidase Cu insertion factor (SCO1/SenC/PrrC family)